MPLTARQALLLVAALSVGAVAAAAFTQHAWEMQPCPWCVLQRVIFLAIALAALLAAALPVGVARRAAMLPVFGLAGAGMAAALWQHFVASSAESCNLTLADRIVGSLGLDAWWPALFMATASCAESQVKLFGLPYEFWSFGVFALVDGLVLLALLTELRRR